MITLIVVILTLLCIYLFADKVSKEVNVRIIINTTQTRCQEIIELPANQE